MGQLIFIDKLDRVGDNPWKVLAQAREKLKLNAAAAQVGLCVGMGVCFFLHLINSKWRGRIASMGVCLEKAF